MAQHRIPPFGAPGGSNDDWDDWNPDRAHRGYTGHARALRDLDLGHEPAIDLPSPVARPRSPASGLLSPAALALSARADTEDYLTVAYDIHEPGFAELHDALIVPQWSASFGRLLLSVFLTLPRATGHQVLDIACGSGYPTLELARFLGQDCDLAGIDVWEEAIQIARRKAADEWLRNVTFLVADVMESGLPERAFDTLTCNLGLASFADRPAALGAMWRLLRPGGSLLVTLPTQSAFREFLDTYYLTLRDLKLDDHLHGLTRLVAARPTVEQVRMLVERAGFAIERVVSDSFTLRFPTPQAFLKAPVVQTMYMGGWRALIPDLTVRRLVFNEIERRLRVRVEAAGGELVMTVPAVCVSAVRM